MPHSSPTLSLLIFATTSAFAYSNNSPVAGFSSHQLATDLRGTPGVPKADQAPEVLYKQRHAEGYLAGVMDATQGDVWCRPPRIKPGELNELVWTALAAEARRVNESAAGRIVPFPAFPISLFTEDIMKPHFHVLKRNYPRREDVPRIELLKEIGWHDLINNVDYANTCAIRMSLALLRCGLSLPGRMRINDGPYKGMLIEPGQAKLSTILAHNSFSGLREKYNMATAGKSIGVQSGIVSFFRLSQDYITSVGTSISYPPALAGFKRADPTTIGRVGRFGFGLSLSQKPLRRKTLPPPQRPQHTNGEEQSLFPERLACSLYAGSRNYNTSKIPE